MSLTTDCSDSGWPGKTFLAWCWRDDFAENFRLPLPGSRLTPVRCSNERSCNGSVTCNSTPLVLPCTLRSRLSTLSPALTTSPMLSILTFPAVTAGTARPSPQSSHAVKSTGTQKLLLNPLWSLKPVALLRQENMSMIKPSCLPFLNIAYTTWMEWLRKRT